MSSTENKKIIHRFLEEISSQRKSDIFDQIFHPDSTDHLKGALSFYLVLTGFPDFHLNLEHMIADDDNVTVLATFNGTHKGTCMGIPATGRGVTGRVAFNFRLSNHKIVESWAEFEPWGLMQQLGITTIANTPNLVA